jgi:hypothetical protein
MGDAPGSRGTGSKTLSGCNPFIQTIPFVSVISIGMRLARQRGVHASGNRGDKTVDEALLV